MINPTNIFLSGICIADMVTLLTYFCIWIPLTMYGKFTYQYSFWYAQMYASFSIYRYLSSCLTLILDIWRVINIYFPFQDNIQLNVRNAIRFSFACFVVSHMVHIVYMYSHRLSFIECRSYDGNVTLNSYVSA